MLHMDFRNESGVAVIDLEGFVDGGPTTEELHALIKSRLEEDDRTFLLNFEEVDWINSLGVGILVGAYASAKKEEATVNLCGLSTRVSATLEACGVVPKLFEVFPNADSALRSLSQT